MPVQNSTAPLVAQFSALTQEAKQAKEVTARTLRDFQVAQNLTYAMAQQQQAASPAPPKDEDEA
jgi:hypothetical protein